MTMSQSHLTIFAIKMLMFELAGSVELVGVVMKWLMHVYSSGLAGRRVPRAIQSLNSRPFPTTLTRLAHA